MSILPPKMSNLHKIDGLLMSMDFFVATYAIIGELDNNAINFGRHVSEETFLLYTPQDGHFESQALSKNDAFLQYKKKIYQTDEAIILAPNTEGVLRVIFIVEMRIPPFVKIEFENSDYVIKNVRRSEVDIWFEVFDSRKNAFVKKADEIVITSVRLDAEIYDDDEIPEGFI